MAERFAQGGRDLSQMAGGSEAGNGQQDAKEEQHAGGVHLAQNAYHRKRVLVFGILVAVDELGGHPEHTEAEEDAHVRRQVGHGLEYRHEQQGSEAKTEYQIAFEYRGGRRVFLGQVSTGARAWCLAAQTKAEDDQRYQQAHQAWQEQAGNHSGSADLATDPEHGGGHVTDRRPGTSGVSGDHHDTDEQPALGTAADQLAQQGDHDDGGGQVIQRCREEEGQETDDPQQVHALACLDAVGDYFEPFMGVDQLDDGHRPEQEEEDLRNFAEVVTQRFDYHGRRVRRVMAARLQQRKDLVGAQHQNGPGQHRGEDRRGSLVYFQWMFKGYA